MHQFVARAMAHSFYWQPFEMAGNCFSSEFGAVGPPKCPPCFPNKEALKKSFRHALNSKVLELRCADALATYDLYTHLF